MLTFPYVRKGSLCFPVVDVSLSGPAASLAVKALVDSGASLSVFRAEILEYLGVPLERGSRMYLEGIGGRIVGYLHHLPAAVGGRSCPLRVVFSRELTVSFNLLGRDNFFHHFRITFDERRRHTQLRRY